MSILVAAWNEAETIGRHIESVLALSHTNKEYVLCAGGADRTYELASRALSGHTGTVLLAQNSGEGKQGALRRGFARCTGEFVMLTDADCLLDDTNVARLLEPLLTRLASAATGSSRPMDEQLSHPLARYQWYRDVYWHRSDGPWAEGLLGRNCVIERAALAAIGAFNSQVATGTDYHLAGLLRARGIRIAATASVVQTRVPTEISSYVRMWQRWTKNLLVQGPSSGRPTEAWQALVAGAAGAFVLLGPAAALLNRWLGVLAVVVACRGWVERVRQCVAALSALGRVEGPSFFAWLWVYYMADCLAAATAPLALVSGNWRRRW